MCRAEAPGVEQFAREHADIVRVVGLGTQDSAEEAVDFVADGGDYSFPMYWESEDTGYASWAAFGITGQPAAVLVSADGTALGQWQGQFNESQVLDLIENPPAS